MAMDLHHVFPGIGPGAPHDSEQDLVNDFLGNGVDNSAQIKMVGA
jgi:hypothetical protein